MPAISIKNINKTYIDQVETEVQARQTSILMWQKVNSSHRRSQRMR